MAIRLLADMVVLIHFLWILFLVFGAIPGRRYRLIRFMHISGLLFAFILQIFDWYCPLTHLEVWLRDMHGLSGSYTGSFIFHYLEKVIYLEAERWVILVLIILLCGMHVLIYGRGRSA